MNNEEKILSILEQIQGDITVLKQGQENNQRLDRLAAKVDEHEQRIFAIEQALHIEK